MPGFPRPFRHGIFVSPPKGGQVQGDKALIGGTHEGGHNFDRLHPELKVLLLFFILL